VIQSGDCSLTHPFFLIFLHLLLQPCLNKPHLSDFPGSQAVMARWASSASHAAPVAFSVGLREIHVKTRGTTVWQKMLV
jgi:hypothetical protein